MPWRTATSSQRDALARRPCRRRRGTRSATTTGSVEPAAVIKIRSPNPCSARKTNIYPALGTHRHIFCRAIAIINSGRLTRLTCTIIANGGFREERRRVSGVDRTPPAGDEDRAARSKRRESFDGAAEVEPWLRGSLLVVRRVMPSAAQCPAPYPPMLMFNDIHRSHIQSQNITISSPNI